MRLASHWTWYHSYASRLLLSLLHTMEILLYIRYLALYTLLLSIFKQSLASQPLWFHLWTVKPL